MAPKYTQTIIAYISVGPYQNLWFTELLGNHIGRITVDGEMSRYEIPFENSRPIVTFRGPKDSIWYTEENGNAYGTISQLSLIHISEPTRPY